MVVPIIKKDKVTLFQNSVFPYNKLLKSDLISLGTINLIAWTNTMEDIKVYNLYFILINLLKGLESVPSEKYFLKMKSFENTISTNIFPKTTKIKLKVVDSVKRDKK